MSGLKINVKKKLFGHSGTLSYSNRQMCKSVNKTGLKVLLKFWA